MANLSACRWLCNELYIRLWKEVHSQYKLNRRLKIDGVTIDKITSQDIDNLTKSNPYFSKEYNKNKQIINNSLKNVYQADTRPTIKSALRKLQFHPASFSNPFLYIGSGKIYSKIITVISNNKNLTSILSIDDPFL